MNEHPMQLECPYCHNQIVWNDVAPNLLQGDRVTVFLRDYTFSGYVVAVCEDNMYDIVVPYGEYSELHRMKRQDIKFLSRK